jgi:hypothetical protein
MYPYLEQQRRHLIESGNFSYFHRTAAARPQKNIAAPPQ